ncbi:MAG: hypothetical protein ACQEUM_18300, partial [Pseudomonadota bacterium]
MHQETGVVAAAADGRDPVIGLQLEPQHLRVQERVVGDGETFPEQAERGSIHGNGGVRRLTFWRISAYSDLPPFLYPALAANPVCFTLICDEP